MPVKPNSKDQSKKLSMSQRKKEFIVELRAKVANDDSDRANWKLKMITASNQRMGVKRVTNRPYPDAPNIPLPQTDKLIKKSLPNFVLSSWSPKKIARVRVEAGVQETPQLKQQAQRAELALNTVLRTKIDWFQKLLLAADYLKEKGHCIFDVVEKFETRLVHREVDMEQVPTAVKQMLKKAPKEEKIKFVAKRFKLDPDYDADMELITDVIKQFSEGKDIIEVDIPRITSMPDIEVPLPTKVIVPAYTTDIGTANRKVNEFFLTREKMEERMDKGIYIDKDIDDLDLSGISKGDDDLVENQKQQNEGVSNNSGFTDLFRIHEICCWWKPKKSKPAERWVFTFLADCLDPEEALLREIPFPYEFKTWNSVKIDNEVRDPRYFASRGTPEQIRGIQEMLERSVNNMLIRDEMNNTPTWEVLSTSELLDRHTRFVPGELIPVSQIGAEIRKLNDPITVDISSERIMSLLKAYAEEYMASTDQLFRNASNAGGGKTLGEINEGVRQSSGPLNVEVINWHEGLSKVYKMVFDLMKERMGEPMVVDGVVIVKEDFNFPAEVKSNGTLEVADKELATQKALMRIQLIGQWMQMGVANQEDVYNGAKDYLEKDGIKDPDEFVTDPKIIMQEQIVQMQQQLQALQQQAQKLAEENIKSEKDLAKVQKTNVKARIQKAAEAREVASVGLQSSSSSK